MSLAAAAALTALARRLRRTPPSGRPVLLFLPSSPRPDGNRPDVLALVATPSLLALVLARDRRPGWLWAGGACQARPWPSIKAIFALAGAA
jgi:hypothetical protein